MNAIATTPADFLPLIHTVLEVVMAERATLPQAPLPVLVTVDDAATRLGIGVRTVRLTLARHPRLFLRVGHRQMVRWPQYLDWLATQTAIPTRGEA